MRHTPTASFPAESDRLPDGLHREIPDGVDGWEAFEAWLGRAVAGEKQAFYDRVNEAEFGIISGETTDDIDEQIRAVEEEIAFDYALLELVEARIARRRQRIRFLRSVREDYEEWDYDAELERLDIETAEGDDGFVNPPR